MRNYILPIKLQSLFNKWVFEVFHRHNRYTSKKLEANENFQKIKHEIFHGDHDGCSDFYEHFIKEYVTFQ